MKKLILIIITAIIACSCVRDYKKSLDLKEGDLRYTLTDEYVIVEKCTSFNGIGEPFWQCIKIINRNSSDSLLNEIKTKIDNDTREERTTTQIP